MRFGISHAKTLIAAAIIAFSANAASASADTAGTVHFVRSADTAFASYVNSPSPELQSWFGAHFWRMIVWSPYFDERTSWYGRGWLYDDAFAIYPGSAVANQHPEWILRDGAQNKLYIPYACSGGTCPQYAGDISNPAFRHNWIEEARTHLAHGYEGLFVDDVDMEEAVSNGQEQRVAPIDSHTGQPMAAANWRAYMAEFMAEVRAAFPSAEIAHNAVWFSNSDAGTSDPSIRKEIESANYVYLERGVNDSGLTGGSGPWSLSALFNFVDQVHALRRGIVLEGSSGEAPGMEYNLASYFLLSTGNDGVSSEGQTPQSWWPGFNVNLGEASGARYGWNGLLRRDFSGGTVLVNAPGSTTATIALASPMQQAGGGVVTSVTLPAASGVVLVGHMTAAGAATGPQPTETILRATPLGRRVPAARASSAARPGRHATAHGRSHTRVGSQRRRRHAAPQRSRTGRGARVTKLLGTVLHASAGVVTITIEVRRHHRWVAARSLRVKVAANGGFATLVKLHPSGVYRAVAQYLGTPSYAPSSSGFHVLVLHAR